MAKRRTKKVVAEEVCQDASQREEAFIACHYKELPSEVRLEAAEWAYEEQPVNEVNLISLWRFLEGVLERFGAQEVPPNKQQMEEIEKAALAALSSKYWGPKGVDLGVAFLDNPSASLRRRILDHANAWNGNGRANVRFREASVGMAQVRIARERSQGYWSYLGFDITKIRNGPTMNLEGFSDNTPESTFRRVCRHEFGHTLGFPHEHLRSAIIERLDRAKTLAYFRQAQGWDDRTTISNVLTPLEERSLIGVPPLDEQSSMTYSLPGSITKDGRPIVGGSDITETDMDYIATIYPVSTPPPPPPPSGGTWKITLPGGISLTGTGTPPVVQQSSFLEV